MKQTKKSLASIIITVLLLVVAAAFVGFKLRPPQPLNSSAAYTKNQLVSRGSATSLIEAFSDVPPGYWAAPHINRARQLGYFRGCSATNFCPDAFATRAEAAVAIARFVRGPEFDAGSGAPQVFKDVPSTYWAAGALNS